MFFVPIISHLQCNRCIGDGDLVVNVVTGDAVAMGMWSRPGRRVGVVIVIVAVVVMAMMLPW